MIHFIYVAGNINGPIKIGVTTDVIRRMRELQTGSPARIHLLFVHPAGSRNRAFEIEQLVHDCWSQDDVQLSGEWFNISAADAVELLVNEIALDAHFTNYKEWKTLFEDVEFVE